jgi:hypothetical protein
MRGVSIIFCLITQLAYSQPSGTDSLANELVSRHQKINSAKMSSPGYRIQIYFGSDRAKAQEVRNSFVQMFPNSPIYLLYQQPNFKVRAGDFRTRLEANRFLKSMGDRFRPAFIVPDEIKLPEL